MPCPYRVPNPPAHYHPVSAPQRIGYDREEIFGRVKAQWPDVTHCGVHLHDSPYRDRVEQGLPPFVVDGDWPWHAAFFPKPS